MSKCGIRGFMVIFCLLTGVAVSRAEKILIHTPKPYQNVVQEVQKRGGRVTRQFQYVDAIAADVPQASVAVISAVAGVKSVQKDLIVRQPGPASDRRGVLLFNSDASIETRVLGPSDIPAMAVSHPDDYLINNTLMNLGPVHAQGFTGQGIRVAVIDTGIRSFPGIGPFPTIVGKILGGEDLVGDGLGFSNVNNDGHGTFVAGLIVSGVAFGFSPTSSIVTTIQTYCPTCVLTLPGSSLKYIPIIGSAPDARIYGLRVFGPSGGGPVSGIIAAMERVITLRDQFDRTGVETQNPDGSYSSLNVKVCNMSLGGLAFYAGRELEDQLTSAFADHDILLAVAAGNEGPAGSTIGSPGTGFDALTVGAASSSIHERILRQLQLGGLLGPQAGLLYRPYAGTQTAEFSSRGPTADGRSDPEVVANGFASFGMGFGSTINTLSFASGTSASSPSVAGVAAVLRQAVSGANARQIRNAIRLTGNPSLIQDGSGPFDRGSGMVDAAAALAMLRAGRAPNTPGAQGLTKSEVVENIEELTAIHKYEGDVTRSASNLLPGQRFETYYLIEPEIQKVIVTVFGVKTGTVQNALFGDDILLTVHNGKTGDPDYPVATLTGGGSYTINNPEPGLLRVTLNGDTTNASPISASVNIVSISGDLNNTFASGTVADGNFTAIPFAVPPGVGALDFRLEWKGDWSRYPTNDIDLILFDPTGGVNVAGATANSPELVHIPTPAAGVWTAIVDGYSIPNGSDNYKLRISADGRPLRH